MYKMKSTVYFYDKRMNNFFDRIIQFKANKEYGFYYNEDLKWVYLSKFAKNVKKISIVTIDGIEFKKTSNKLGNFGDDYIKIEYVDGTIKVIDYAYSSQLYFYEVKI